jgi:ribonuclease J
MGIVEKVILLEDGDILELDKDAVKNGKVTVGGCASTPAGRSMWWRTSSFATASTSREDGIVLPIITINKRTAR